MAWPLPEKFRSNIPLRDMVTAEIMQTLCQILNNIVIEQIDGLSDPTIEKTASPSPETPWKILIPAQAAADVPEPSSATPQPDTEDGAAGSLDGYSRADHSHPIALLDPPATDTDLRTNTEASLPTMATAGTSWTRDLVKGQLRTIVCGVYYSHTATAPELRCYYREEYLDALGRVYYTGPLQYYVIDTPTLVTWSAT